MLGDIALNNGLATSLLERLHIKYKEEMSKGDNLPLITMATNFRCHPDILKLTGSLFYRIPLRLPDGKQLLWTQPYTSDSACFRFVCSDVDESVQEVTETTNNLEAEVILKELMMISDYRNWPREWGECDLKKASIMSQSRRQVCVEYTLSASLK